VDRENACRPCGAGGDRGGSGDFFDSLPALACRPALSRHAAVVDRSNIYGEAGRNHFSRAVAGALERIYVPISVRAMSMLSTAHTSRGGPLHDGRNAQHVVPSWDLRTLWVTGSASTGRRDGSLTPIDPKTGKPGTIIAVPDAYNMYFTPDGRAAIVVAEAQRRLEFRDPRDMALEDALPVRECDGINHADFAADGSYAIFTCEFGGGLVKLDLLARRIVGHLSLSRGRMPRTFVSHPTAASSMSPT